MFLLPFSLVSTHFNEGNAHHALEALDKLDYSIISVDWGIEPADARKLTSKVLQGNLDPCLLFAPPDVIRQRTRDMMESFTHGNYICNLGHGMMPDHDPEQLRVYLESVVIYIFNLRETFLLSWLRRHSE